jgi:quercetin dioxygenase-like cupin family protein
MNDDELKRLLHEWKAPDAPPHLRAPRGRRPRLDWLLRGSIRVPVPVALAAVLVLGISIFWRPQPATLPESIAREPSGELARYALSGPFEGYEAVLVDLRFAAGASAPAHRHPGFVLGYVLSGQLRSAIDSGPDQIVPAGATFFEPTGVLHSGFGSGGPDAPVRVLAFLVVPAGSRLTEPG